MTSKGDLNSALKSHAQGRFEETRTAKYILQVAQALEYLNSKGIIHYDVKPENILLDDKGILSENDFYSLTEWNTVVLNLMILRINEIIYILLWISQDI